MYSIATPHRASWPPGLLHRDAETSYGDEACPCTPVHSLRLVASGLLDVLDIWTTRHHVDLWVHESSWLMAHETSGLLDVLDVWLSPRVRVLEATHSWSPCSTSIAAALHYSRSPRARCVHHVSRAGHLEMSPSGVMVGLMDPTSHPEISGSEILHICDV